MKKILVVLMAALLLGVFALGAAAEAPAGPALSPAPEGSFTPVQAVVSGALHGASNLTNTADDYDVPQGTYFNGVPLTITAVEPTIGNYPAELKDEEQLWAQVVIGRTETFDGIEGLMPLVNLSLDLSLAPAALPEAALSADSVLYTDNGLSGRELGSFKQGTPVKLLGWLLGWAHVEIEGQTGFVRTEQLALDGPAAETVKQALPVDFDEIQPGYQQRYADYMQTLMALYDKYGDSNHWPLEVNAQASRLAQEAGFTFTDVIHVMPGEDDLSEQQVIDAALKAAETLYGLGPDSWTSTSLAFFHDPLKPEEQMWKASLWGREGVTDVKIWMDRQGEPVSSMIAEMPNESEWEPSAPNTDSLDYYYWGLETQPQADEMDAQAAMDLAWTVFTGELGEGDRAAYILDAHFYTNDDSSLRWWLVSIQKDLGHEVLVQYHVAMVMPDGKPAYFTAKEDYLQEISWAENLAEFYRLEAEKGPFHTWTLEEKAAWEPEYFGLPEPGDLSQEQALQIALERVKTDYKLSDEDLKQFDTAYFFVVDPQRAWQVSFLHKNPSPEIGAPGYTFILDARTGEVQDVFTNEFEGFGE